VLQAEDRRGLVLAPATDPEAFGRAVAELASEPDRLRAVAAGGRALFDREFAWERIVARLEGALDRA
jgi:glycosyltransferase involved in cell wall biosynthesis